MGTARTPSERDFLDGFCQRTREARERANFSQTEIAQILDISRARYDKWENRNPMELAYLARFCLLTRTDPMMLLTHDPADAIRFRARLARAKAKRNRKPSPAP